MHRQNLMNKMHGEKLVNATIWLHRNSISVRSFIPYICSISCYIL